MTNSKLKSKSCITVMRIKKNALRNLFGDILIYIVPTKHWFINHLTWSSSCISSAIFISLSFRSHFPACHMLQYLSPWKQSLIPLGVIIRNIIYRCYNVSFKYVLAVVSWMECIQTQHNFSRASIETRLDGYVVTSDVILCILNKYVLSYGC